MLSKHILFPTLVFASTFFFLNQAVAESPVSFSSKSHVHGVSDKEVIIGMSNALSGPAQDLGTNLKLGAEVYFDKINKAGGVHGRQIKLISYDDGYEPVRTITNTKRLLEDDVFALFGYVGTPTSKVAVPIAVRADIPYLFPFTGAEFLRRPVTKNVFNLRASYFNETAFLVNHLVHDRNVKRVALFIQDDGYGAAGRAGVQRALENYGQEVVAVGKYTRNTVDIDKAYAKVWDANPDVVIMVGAYQPCAEFVKKSKREGKQAAILNISFVGTSSFIKEAGPAGEGSYISQVVPHPISSNLDVVRTYRNDFVNTGHAESINFGTLEGYLNAITFVKALEEAGKNLSRDKFIETMESLKFNEGGLPISFTPEQHQGLKRVYLTKVVNGKAVEIEHVSPNGLKTFGH